MHPELSSFYTHKGRCLLVPLEVRLVSGYWIPELPKYLDGSRVPTPRTGTSVGVCQSGVSPLETVHTTVAVSRDQLYVASTTLGDGGATQVMDTLD